jgi:hypothetical protein
MFPFFFNKPSGKETRETSHSRFARIRKKSPKPLTLRFRRAPQAGETPGYELVDEKAPLTTPFSTAAKPKTLLRAVGLNLATTAIVFTFASSQAFDAFRLANHLPNQTIHGWFGTHIGPASVSYSMLGGWTQALLMALVLIYPVLHALIARLIFGAIHALCVLGDRAYLPNGDPCLRKWSPDSKMLAGALWPATLLLVPFLLVAAVLGALYRHLWAE